MPSSAAPARTRWFWNLHMGVVPGASVRLGPDLCSTLNRDMEDRERLFSAGLSRCPVCVSVQGLHGPHRV